MYTLTRPFSPSSSPASSPTLAVDSSPASSPDADFLLDLPDPPSLTLVDPYAASAKANKAPPEYEKKPLTPPRSPSGNVSVKRARYAYWQPDSTPCRPVSSPNSTHTSNNAVVETAAQIEAAIWDEASTQVVDNAHGTILLQDRNLTHIPQSFISDISNVYIPPENPEYANFSTDFFPGQAVSAARTRSLKRTRSAVGCDPKEIQLYLSRNNITILPLQLLTLQNLTLLSLRQNSITFIPPEIVCLRNLRELNITNNPIKYLPAEMLKMSLTQLQVFPNLFFLKDPYDEQLSSSTSRTKPGDRPRSISDTKHCLPKVIPLVEMALRVLFSPSSASPGECLLEEYYDLPLDECPSDSTFPSNVTLRKRRFPYPIPSHIRTILSTCVRSSVYPEEQPSNSSISVDDLGLRVTGIGHCDHGRGQSKPGVFLRHVEERYTWESIIAGVSVGGCVPVRWRGCQWGCLDYLDSDGGIGPSDGSELPEIHRVYLHEAHGADNSTWDNEGTEDAVQVIQLSGMNELDEFDSD